MEEIEAANIAEIRVKDRVTSKSATSIKKRDIKCDIKSLKGNMSSVIKNFKKGIDKHCGDLTCKGKKIVANNWGAHKKSLNHGNDV